MPNMTSDFLIPGNIDYIKLIKTGQDGKGLLQIHLWCPDDLPRLWDRIEIEYFAQLYYSFVLLAFGI